MTGPLWTRLPDGWLTGRVKNVATVTLGKMLQSKDGGSDVSAPYMRAANVQPEGLLALDDVNEMWFGEAELEQLSIRAGDVVVVEGGQGGFGRAAYVENDLPGWGFQNSINRLRPIGDFDGRFIAFYLIALRASGYIRAYSNVVSMPHLTAEKLACVPIPLPPVEQQRAIADYLDCETARIDTLIEEQQRLIEMLRERRQAVVDAAFAALGEPSVQLRRYIKFLTSGSRGWGDYYADDGERFLRIGNLPRTNLSIRGEVQFVSLPADVTEGSRTILEAGDLLFSITAYLGSVAVVDNDWVGSYVSQHVALCRLDPDRLDSRFAGWFMLTTVGQDQLNQGAAGGAKMQLALDDIKGLRVPTASIAEQHHIAVHLDEQTEKIDALIAETQRLIELARERRSALITAAVTGQVDVREAA
ncbi:restriction endonuclease subunit S [Streptosporangium sp. NBC_01755]|uniref:restriction endonuclease subunit S n=1 Tax=Streptosporangium sp. NBC_01755 TaxID=2975949 RepID=UPI002DD9CB29|nr:restriction endonuclease subunit S [Streptosporangium sp. NBC_01755]WSD02603.1 restriction endonuclease subunit S [Streptosporangium sp. NBC_01755]